MPLVFETAGIIVAVALLALGLLSAWIVAEAAYYQGRKAKRLEDDLGFRHGSAYPRCNGRTHLGVLCIEAVTPGGVLERAGFRPGDLIPALTITGFFKLLYRGRGREVEVTVIASGDGPELDERPSRTLRFLVPSPEEVKHV